MIPFNKASITDLEVKYVTDALLNGKSAYEAAVIAADYTVKCIEITREDPGHWYGVKFEAALPAYMKMLGL